MSIRKLGVSFLALALFGVAFLFIPEHVLAQADAASQVAESAGLGNADLTVVIGRIISVFLGLLGVIFLVLFIYAGFVWMTAGGDDKKVEKAKRIFINATIGLVIILMAYGITTFVFNLLSDATGTGSAGGSGSVSIERFSGSLGNGPIEDHYPERNQTGVARNTKIMITFKVPVDPNTVTTETVKIYPSASGDSAALTNVAITPTEDSRTFVFDPADLLGSATANTQYTVSLSSAIESVDGNKIFVGANNSGYVWSFTTGTIVDTTAPTIETITPRANGTYDRNIAVQVTFTEPVDPTTATGTRAATSGFDNIAVLVSDVPLPGEYEISNGYRTVTFTPTDECGTNSCGETLYCLPGSSSMNVAIDAASIATAPQASLPYDGIVDMAGNALDGDGDGTAGDDYGFDFATTASINLAGPAIISLSPNILEENVALDQDIEVTFDSVLMSSSVSSSSILLTNKEATSGASHEQWYLTRLSFLTANGDETSGRDDAASRTRVSISHGTFLESVDGKSYLYGVEATDALRNEYQNCYVPAEGPTADNGSCAVTDTEPYCCNGSAQATACVLF